MDELFGYLLQFGTLNQRQLDLIASKATALSLPKDAYFLEAGQVSRRVGFLLEGVLRICYYNNQGAEITRNFIDELHLTTNLRGLEDGLASPEYVQAVTGCRLLVFAKRDWDELAHTIVGWTEIGAPADLPALAGEAGAPQPHAGPGCHHPLPGVSRKLPAAG